MPEVTFLPSLFKESVLWEECKNAPNRGFDDIHLTEEVAFVLFIYLPLADEHVVKGFLDQHMQYTVLGMLEQ